MAPAEGNPGEAVRNSRSRAMDSVADCAGLSLALTPPVLSVSLPPELSPCSPATEVPPTISETTPSRGDGVTGALRSSSSVKESHPGGAPLCVDQSSFSFQAPQRSRNSAFQR